MSVASEWGSLTHPRALRSRRRGTKKRGAGDFAPRGGRRMEEGSTVDGLGRLSLDWKNGGWRVGRMAEGIALAASHAKTEPVCSGTTAARRLFWQDQERAGDASGLRLRNGVGLRRAGALVAEAFFLLWPLHNRSRVVGRVGRMVRHGPSLASDATRSAEHGVWVRRGQQTQRRQPAMPLRRVSPLLAASIGGGGGIHHRVEL